MSRLSSKLRLRVDARDRQVREFKRTHDRGHARAARRDARAVRFLRGLISKQERLRRRRAPDRMFDDVTVALIPKNAPAVLGYVDGDYQTIDEVRKLFPHADILPCTVREPGKARCLDIENGDATPDKAAEHVRKRQRVAPHELPVLYGSISTMPAIEANCKAAGIHRREYDLLSAHYTYKPHICGPKTCGYSTRCNGTQYTDLALRESLDESVIDDEFFLSRP
jgi:hypothetical protein